MTLRTWYLVRHGETEWNAERRMQGQMDSRLSAKGREQAARTGETLARLGVDQVFASPLGRVRETLSLMAPHVTHEPHFDARLMEWSSGDWSGRLYADIRVEDPDLFASWEADRYYVRSPGGENFADLDARAASFLADHGDPPHRRVAIVAHGFFNRAMAARLLGLTPAQAVVLRQTNATIFRVITGDGPPRADHFVGGEGPFAGLPSDVPVAGESA